MISIEQTPTVHSLLTNPLCSQTGVGTFMKKEYCLPERVGPKSLHIGELVVTWWQCQSQQRCEILKSGIGRGAHIRERRSVR